MFATKKGSYQDEMNKVLDKISITDLRIVIDHMHSENKREFGNSYPQAIIKIYDEHLKNKIKTHSDIIRTYHNIIQEQKK